MPPGLICMVCSSEKAQFYYNAIACILRKKDTTPKEYALSLIDRYVQPAISLGFKYIATATDHMNAVKCAQFYANLNKLIVLRGVFQGHLGAFSLKVTLGQAIFDSNCCYSKKAVLDLTPEERRPLLVVHSFVRFTADVLDFVTAIREFIYLSSTDKLLLLQNNFYMILALRGIDQVYSDEKPSELQAELVQETLALSKSHARTLQLILDFIGESAVPVFKETDISKEEIILLQLIICFSQCEECSDIGKEIIRNARNKYTNLLKEYHKECLPQLTKEQRIKRFCTLLHFLQAVKDFSVRFSQSFTSQIVNNDNLMLGQLTYDLNMRVFKHT